MVIVNRSEESEAKASVEQQSAPAGPAIPESAEQNGPLLWAGHRARRSERRATVSAGATAIGGTSITAGVNSPPAYSMVPTHPPIAEDDLLSGEGRVQRQ